MAIRELLEKHNAMPFRGREYSRRSLFMEIEKEELMPLSGKRYEVKRYAQATVHKNSHIYFGKDKHYYSVPYRHIGKQVKLVYTDSIVEIYHKHERFAVHTRNRKKYGYTTLADHMPSHHRFVSEWSSKRFIDWAGNIGEHCKGYIIAILEKKQHPEQSYKSCLGVLHLAKKYGRERLDSACRRASEYGAYNYNMVERILKKGWDQIDDRNDEGTKMPEHKNIRGGKYYE